MSGKFGLIASPASAQWDWGWQAHRDAQKELWEQQREENQRQIERQQDQFRQQPPYQNNQDDDED
jgi:hypothetical protein